ncbi:MAG TPA: rod shape-determining protein [Pseudonocardiaceae bacterium]|nr:rod shape-determining protein [Pseudonocardiaceae bacterium]
MSGLGVDLGTANTVVCHPRQGIVLDEPSLILQRTGGVRRPAVVAIGREARSLVGRAPEGMTAIRPLQDGVITDLDTARGYLVAILRNVATQPWQRLGVKAVIGVPVGASSVERRALLEAADEARISRATLLAEPIAGAVGCGVDPLDRRTHMVVDIGGGTAEVTAFCYGGVLANRSCRMAGDEMTLAVYHYLREQHHLLVGELVAEDIKIHATTGDDTTLVAEGRDAATGRPRLVTVPVDEIADAVKPITTTIVRTLAACLDDLPPQSVGDVMSEGVLLFGGGSLVRGFHQLLEDALGFLVKPAEQPLTCVALGTARCLTNRRLLDAYSTS